MFVNAVLFAVVDVWFVSTTGMAYHCMVCEDVPMSEHDSPMDNVLFVS